MKISYCRYFYLPSFHVSFINLVSSDFIKLPSDGFLYLRIYTFLLRNSMKFIWEQKFIVCYLFDKAFLDLLKVTLFSLCPKVKICKLKKKTISLKWFLPHFWLPINPPEVLVLISMSISISHLYHASLIANICMQKDTIKQNVFSFIFRFTWV